VNSRHDAPRPAPDGGARGPRTNRAGREALGLGVLANLCALVPVIGDLITVPISLLAIGLGAWGVHRADRGLVDGSVAATAGIVLGVLALFLVAAIFLVVEI